MNQPVTIRPDEAATSPAPHKNVARLLQGSIPATLARLSAPNTIAFLIGSAVAVAEMWYVGQVGTQALAGLALGFPMFMLTMMLSAGSMGGAMAAAVARAMGAGERARAETLAWHAILIALVASGLIAVLYLSFGQAFYEFLGGRDGTLAAALAYSDVVFLGGAVVWLINTFSSLLRGAGDMKTPALAMVIASAIQVPLSGILCLGFGPIPGMGIAGVAWGALGAFSCATVFLGVRLFSGASGLRLTMLPPSLHWRHFKEILGVGAMASISPVLSVATVVLLTGLISRFGDEALAGFGVASRLEFLLIPIVFGIGAAMTAMVGTNMGAGQVDRAHRIGWIGGGAAALLAGAIGTATALWPEAWAGIYTENPEVILAATVYLMIVGPFYAFHGLGLSLFFASQGAGTVVWPVTAVAVRLLVTVGGGALAVLVYDAGFAALPTLVAAGMVVTGLGTAASIKFGAWRRAAVRV